MNDAVEQDSAGLWMSAAVVERCRRSPSSGERRASMLIAAARRYWRSAGGAGEVGDGVGAGTDRGDGVSESDLKRIEAGAIVARVDGDPATAEGVHRLLVSMSGHWTHAQLGLANWALHAAIACECCGWAWGRRDRIEAARWLLRLASGQLEVHRHRGNPHTVTNNHWAVSHAGAGLAALAGLRLLGVRPGRRRRGSSSRVVGRLGELAAWASARVAARVAMYGERGFGHEGIGYHLYELSFVLPFVLAAGRWEGVDWRERFACLGRAASSMYATVAAGAGREGVTPKLSWNDDGGAWPVDGSVAALLCLAGESDRARLDAMFDRLSLERWTTPGRDGEWGGRFGGWFFALLSSWARPEGSAGEPIDGEGGARPPVVFDGRQGMWIVRDGYRDGEDVLVGVYAKSSWPGGHRQEDAGSVRLVGLGRSWAVGGGQARAARRWQSVMLPSDDSCQRDGLGWVMGLIEDGPTRAVAIDLRKVSLAYHERYVGVNFDLGPRATMAVLDQVDDHLGREWEWCWSLEDGLICELDPEGGGPLGWSGFRLRSGDGSRLTARFMGTPPTGMTLERTPDSERTYQSGRRVGYPGHPFVRVRFASGPRLGVLAVLTLEDGSSSWGERIEPLGGVSVQVGGRGWRRPFGVLVPRRYVPGASGGLCKYPSGLDGYEAGRREA